jgi:TonB-linked SusC/RagA family outer membrane protein
MQLTAIFCPFSWPGIHRTPQIVRVMKLSAVFLLAASLHVAARSSGQTVTLDLRNVPVQKVFKEASRQTGISIIYNEALFAGLSPVTIKVKDVSIQQVLDLCLKDQPFGYSLQGNLVQITKKPVAGLGAVNTATAPPPIDIHGRVTDSLGNPLAGASVAVKGAKKGTVTDANGFFDLKGVDERVTLVITFTGYVAKEYRANVEIKLVTIRLAHSNNPLDEVQVIAYGTTTERFSTGDVTTVKAADIEKQPVSDFLAAMEGRVPGMNITQQTGVPGGAYTVQIRGLNSISSGNDPLYLVDGVPYSSVVLQNNGGSIIGGGSPLNYINPSDVESIEILKDADATAIYGSRGANGVVLISTKKGKAGDMRVDANFYTGNGQADHRMKMLNLPQYLAMRHEAFANDGATPGTYDYDINGTWDSTRSTDWQKVFIGGHSQFTHAQLSASGGNEFTQYMVGATYHRETTVFPGDFADQKTSVHFNITSSSKNKKFKLLLTGNYQNDFNNLLNIDFTGQTFLPPDAPPLHNADGTLNWADGSWSNPLALTLQKYILHINNLVGNSVLSYEILRGLDLKASLGYTLQVLTDINITPIAYFPPSYNITTGTASFTNNNTHSWIVEPQLTYNHSFGKLSLNALAGTTIQENVATGQVLNGSGYSSDALLESLQGASLITQYSVTNKDYKYNALFGRVELNWADKYLVNLNARRDGSSRFGPGNQFGNFGSVGAAWIFTKENVVAKAIPLLSFGKLRGSYGTSGNDQIGDYQYLSLYNFTTGVPYQGATGTYPANLNNPNYSWEINRKLEGGIELGFLKDRILFSASYYRNRSSNELVGYSLPDIAGFTAVTENLPALVQNTGWEFVLNTVNINSKNYRWTSSINLTISRNKLVSFPNFENSPYQYTYVIGQPLNVMKTYHMIGVNDTTGVYEFANNKGGATYTPAYTTDRIANIDPNPKYYGGFQNAFSYKGFTLDFLFQFKKQIGIQPMLQLNVPPGVSGYYNMPSYVLNRWQKPGDNKPIERFTQNYGGNAYAAYTIASTSDAAYVDASFIRLKNVSISYTLAASWMKAVHIQNCRIYVQCQNLLTITRYAGFDPENLNVNSLPPLRIITGGIEIIL